MDRHGQAPGALGARPTTGGRASMSARRPDRRALVGAGLVLLSTAIWGGESSSPRFILQQITVNAAGTTSQGPGHVLSASLGQEVTVGTSSSVPHVAQSGFWSFFGSGLAPVLLMAQTNPGNSQNVDLTWTGHNAPYAVFQSSNCTDVFSALFATTPDRRYDNISPPPAALVCFNVLATAPGP